MLCALSQFEYYPKYEQAMRTFPLRCGLLGLVAASLVLPQINPEGHELDRQRLNL